MRRSWNALLILLLVSVAHAQMTPLVSIYGMREKKALKRVLIEYEELLRVDPNSSHVVKVLGIAYHNLAVQKVSGAVAKATAYLKEAKTLLPKDAEVLAYLGSAKTMVARDSWNPVTKVREVRKGTRLIDMAVARDRDNVAIRFVRANNSLALPRFFNRVRYAKADLQHLLRLSASDDERANSFSPEMVAEIHFKLGKIYKHENEDTLANDHCTKAVEIAPNSEWGREACKRL